MEVKDMRVAIKKPYDTRWRDRVDKMPDKQVIAVYFRMKASGIIKEVKKREDYCPFYA